MKLKKEILTALRKSEGYFSGERLSRDLKLSRTAIWKKIQTLREDGYKIEARPRLGYFLKETPDFLLPQEIELGLKTKILGRKKFYFLKTETTIEVAKDLVNKDYPEGTLVIAEEQSGGRGRLGRRWFSPRGGIWFSLILRPPISPVEAPKLTLMAAVATAKAIKEVTGLETKIKWPNDLTFSGKKVGGILSEIDAEPDQVIFAILSLGLNVNMSLKKFPFELRHKVISLKEVKGGKIDRVLLFQAILKNLEEDYLEFRQGKLEPLFSKYRRLSETLGKRVKIKTTSGIFKGLAQDIDEHGALLLKLPSGRLKTIPSGDATLL